MSQSSRGASKEIVTDAAYRCYQDFKTILESSNTPISRINEARERMLKIMPQLYNGAALYQNEDPRTAVKYAKAYLDIRDIKIFSSYTFPQNSNFAQLSFFVANLSFKPLRQYNDVVKYARSYLSTGDFENRKYAYWLLAQSYQELGNSKGVQATMEAAIEEFPNEYAFLSLIINTYLDNSESFDLDKIQKYVSLAMNHNPNDVSLLNIQGKLYEDKGDYINAVNIYSRIKELKPNILSVEEHLAVDNYNIGVMYNNKCLMLSSVQSSEEFKRNSELSTQYFSKALTHINMVLNTVPNSVKYIEAQAIAYQFTGNKDGFQSANRALASLGAETIPDNYIPFFISADSNKNKQNQANPDAGGQYKNQDTPSAEEIDKNLPYSIFLKRYVESKIAKWQKKGEFETSKQFMDRVNVKTRETKVAQLKEEALSVYINGRTPELKIHNFKLSEYDADNQTYLIDSEYGEIILPVPLSNNEALVFKNSWTGVQVSDPRFYIMNDSLRISSLTFTTPIGQKYHYDAQNASDYVGVNIELDFSPIDYDTAPNNQSAPKGHKQPSRTISVGISDVDRNIPESGMRNESTFAFIIANEDYVYVPKVEMAHNDGKIFAEYCNKTLGIPEHNIKVFNDATYGNILKAVNDIKKIAGVYQEEAKFVVYYSGHGIPDETDKGAYLLPVDAEGTSTESCYPLNKLYDELGNTGAESVLVFLDACFSGATRGDDMLSKDARGVVINPKISPLSGNTVVFSAASSSQTAYPYTEMSHGMFTYYLLKKLQETSGDVTLKELGDYIEDRVSKSSLQIRGKLQTPTVFHSAALPEWGSIKLVH